MLQVSHSFREFLDGSDNRIAKFISRAINYQYEYSWSFDTKSRHHVKVDWNAPNLMIKTDEVNYLTLRDDGTISYLPKGKPHVVNDDGKWAREGRQNGAPARIIRKLLTPKALKLFKDSEFEAFANKYKSAVSCAELEVRDASEIPNIYCYPLDGCGGTLGSSCMNGDRDYVEMYAHVPNLKIVCMFSDDGDRLRGRALLWTLGDGSVFMDRVYTLKDHEADVFVRWAEKNGYYHKKYYTTYKDPELWVKNGEEITKYYKVFTDTDFDYYPYIDTFRFGGDGWISNNSSGCDYVYEHTDGSREGDDGIFCEITGNRYHEDDVRYIERGQYNGCYIHMDYTIYCETDNYFYYESSEDIVEIDCNWYRKDDEDVCQTADGDWHMTDDCKYSEMDDEWHLEDDVVYSQHHETYILKTEAYDVDGNYFHESVVNKLA